MPDREKKKIGLKWRTGETPTWGVSTPKLRQLFADISTGIENLATEWGQWGQGQPPPTQDELDEEMYGVKFNYMGRSGWMMMPDGSITTRDWWDDLSPRQKEETTGRSGVKVDKKAGIVTLPSGKTYDYNIWAKKTPEQQQSLVKVEQPAIDQNAPQDFSWKAKQYEQAYGIKLPGAEAVTPLQWAVTEALIPQFAELQRYNQAQAQAEQEKQLQMQSTDAKNLTAIMNAMTKAQWGIKNEQIKRGEFPKQGETVSEWQGRAKEGSMPSSYPGGQPGGDVGKGLSMTPWGVMVAPGERASAPPESQYAGQTYVAPTFGGYGGGGGGGRWDIEGMQRRTEQTVAGYGKFEDIRQEILSTTEPSNWIIRARARNALNPYATRSGGQPGSWMETQRTEPLTPQLVKKQLGASGVGEIPPEIRNMISGGFGSPVNIPSAPTWSVTPEATKQMLYPYMQEMGQQPTDFLSYMRSMLPNEPSRGTAWTPSRQRR